MKDYNNIILAVDLDESSHQSAKKAVAIAKENNAKLTIVHAVEHISAYGLAPVYPTIAEVEETLLKNAKKRLEELCEKCAITEAEKLIEIGSPKTMIIDQAKKRKADLIVLGSHGRHGLSLLLGSTANAVLHHAPCDVLAVRIKM